MCFNFEFPIWKKRKTPHCKPLKARAKSFGIHSFLEKPVRQRTISRAIRDVLDGQE